ncbi:hypothetical protein PFNF54_02979 [Plasmodium falciparum NF54]|uniref:Rifin n=1 Tax=Plasmodium falciparum (isolate NF54) TaxID=5843 RepID=W7K4F9_PLAFO|nr:hypothetical protein PFNF54_02979 [Plasmodium falciparum NF54]
MKSVKENFDRQTSKRFDEYEERMKDKRQKRKEERDKNIQEIIEKDRKDKSLAEKVEKGCLRCGCALGGVAASVGLFGGLGIYVSKSAALATAIAEGAETAKAAGEAARIPAAIDAVIKGIETKFGVSTLGGQKMETFFNTTLYTEVSKIADAVYNQYAATCITSGNGARGPICTLAWQYSESRGNVVSAYNSIEVAVKPIVSQAETVAERAVKTATDEAIQRSIGVVESTYAICQTAIIASVVAIIIIALVMIIIYLVLRYRRKKKMNKKLQYTKLLNQ